MCLLGGPCPQSRCQSAVIQLVMCRQSRSGQTGTSETHVSHTGASPVLRGTHRPIMRVSTKHSADRGRGAHRAPPAVSGRNQEAAGRPSVLPALLVPLFFHVLVPSSAVRVCVHGRCRCQGVGAQEVDCPLRDWVPQSPGHVTKARSP